jgi:Skp family chaperone for outer membrane proteins
LARIAPHIVASLICGTLLFAGVGCNKEDTTAARSTSSGPSVGVVDLDRVGKAMGWQDEMQHNLQATDAELKRVIESRLHSLQDAFEQKRKEIATADNLTAAQITSLNSAKEKSDLVKLGLTDKQIDDLVQASSAVQMEATSANNAYQQHMQQRAAAIQKAYRDAVGPVVRRVAVANGRSVVFTPIDGLIYSDPANDLTDRVIDDLQKSPPIKVNLPEIPHVATTTEPTTQP